MKLLSRKSVMMLMFSLIILTGVSLPRQSFMLFSFCNSLKVLFLSINLKENDRYMIGIILGLVILSPRLLSMSRLGMILLKNVLNVLASSSLFVSILLLSFNVMNSLWKVFSDKRGPIVFQIFLLSAFCLSFRNSLSYFYAKYSHDIFLSFIIQNLAKTFIFFHAFFLMTSFTRWIIITIIF